MHKLHRRDRLTTLPSQAKHGRDALKAMFASFTCNHGFEFGSFGPGRAAPTFSNPFARFEGSHWLWQSMWDCSQSQSQMSLLLRSIHLHFNSTSRHISTPKLLTSEHEPCVGASFIHMSSKHLLEAIPFYHMLSKTRRLDFQVQVGATSKGN